jgi:O-antigen ligase
MRGLNRFLSVPLLNPTLVERAAGVSVLCLGMLPLIAERSTPALLALVALTFATLGRIERQNLSFWPSATTITLWASLGYATLSAVWSLDPADALAHTGTALVMLFSAQIVANWLCNQSRERLRFLAFWLLVGVCLGMTYIFVEMISFQGIRRFLIGTFLMPEPTNKMYRIDGSGNIFIRGSELNRNVAAANLFLWPALLCAYRLFKTQFRLALCATILAAILFVTFYSVHETSKFALPITLGVFLVALFWPRTALYGTLIGLVLAVVAVVPLAIYAHQTLKLDKSDMLQFSAQQRIVIWGTLAERVADAPILGVGVRSTYAMNLDERGEGRSSPDTLNVPTHPHNVYLQTWFELGLIGALFLGASGVALLSYVSRLPVDTIPFGLAALVMGLCQIASSFDIWQRWYFALLTISCLLVTLSTRVDETTSEERSA